MGVSTVTMSLWECDKKHPAWKYQARLIEYLGFNPFTNPELGRPLGNESSGVAISALEASQHIGDQIRLRRIQMRKTRYQLAPELGISVKTLWNWENHRQEPSLILRKVVDNFLRTGESKNSNHGSSPATSGRRQITESFQCQPLCPPHNDALSTGILGVFWTKFEHFSMSIPCLFTTPLEPFSSAKARPESAITLSPHLSPRRGYPPSASRPLFTGLLSWFACFAASPTSVGFSCSRRLSGCACPIVHAHQKPPSSLTRKRVHRRTG